MTSCALHNHAIYSYVKMCEPSSCSCMVCLENSIEEFNKSYGNAQSHIHRLMDGLFEATLL
jgi:hypothetical protein